MSKKNTTPNTNPLVGFPLMALIVTLLGIWLVNMVPTTPPSYNFGFRNIVYIVMDILLQSLFLLNIIVLYNHGYPENIYLKYILFSIIPTWSGFLLIWYNVRVFKNLGSNFYYPVLLFWFSMIFVGGYLYYKVKSKNEC